MNWEEYLRLVHPGEPVTFDAFAAVLKNIYAKYTFDFAARESGVDARILERIAEDVANCGGKLAAHNGGARRGEPRGWQVARCLWFLSVLTVHWSRGHLGKRVDKWSPGRTSSPRRQALDGLTGPGNPLSYFEMIVSSHFRRKGAGSSSLLHPRLQPDVDEPGGVHGGSPAGRIEDGLHVALSRSGANRVVGDYVLPMGTLRSGTT